MAARNDDSTIALQFDHLDEARSMIEHLEDRGVDGSVMHLTGPALPAEDEPGEMAAQDRRTAGREGKATLRGAAIGSGIGFAVGLLAGLALYLVMPSEEATGALVALLLGGGAVGFLVGIPIGAYRGVKQSPAWEETFHTEQPGPVVLEIRLEDDEQLATVRDALASVQQGSPDQPTTPGG